jgi:desulfoferrodoxin (superoxide reductase-like protein)
LGTGIGVWADDYTIEGEIQTLLLLKVIIRESRGDTNHRKLVLRQQLSSLDVKLESLGWSITKLHTHVKDTVEDLTALGETTQDLLANLFKAYAKVPDDEFVLYVNTKRQLYDEGTNYTPEQIMTFAGDKYKQRVEDKTWIAPSKDQEKIVALEAAVAKLTKKTKTTSNVTTTSNNNSGPQRAEWQMIKPTEAEIKNKYTKKVDGKVFKWCNKHGFWSKHSTEQCRLPDKNSTNDEDEQKPKAKSKSTTTTTQNKKAKLVQALESIHDVDDGMETDEE